MQEPALPVFKFSEVLNDTVSTLLWADLQTLLDFQRERQLPADLAQVFTTEASGDEVLAQGALIALAGIANLAYSVRVLAGWTQQPTGMEPTLELLLTSQAMQPAYANHLFTIEER